ncbi:hypothetical protein QTP88_021121 [Uroleucon formosanum]
MRVSPETLFYILEKIRPYLEKYCSFRKCIIPEERLVVTLSFIEQIDKNKIMKTTFIDRTFNKKKNNT